uniref:CSON012395 protein n=1 Tax=Culicoides sonorensis TaxID=179676 RepID=A0A336MHJ2_CULSO
MKTRSLMTSFNCPLQCCEIINITFGDFRRNVMPQSDITCNFISDFDIEWDIKNHAFWILLYHVHFGWIKAHSLLIAISTACCKVKLSVSSHNLSNTCPGLNPVINLSNSTISKLSPNRQSTDSFLTRPYHDVTFSWGSCRAL